MDKWIFNSWATIELIPIRMHYYTERSNNRLLLSAQHFLSVLYCPTYVEWKQGNSEKMLNIVPNSQINFLLHTNCAKVTTTQWEKTTTPKTLPTRSLWFKFTKMQELYNSDGSCCAMQLRAILEQNERS